MVPGFSRRAIRVRWWHPVAQASLGRAAPARSRSFVQSGAPPGPGRRGLGGLWCATASRRGSAILKRPGSRGGAPAAGGLVRVVGPEALPTGGNLTSTAENDQNNPLASGGNISNVAQDRTKDGDEALAKLLLRAVLHANVETHDDGSEHGMYDLDMAYPDGRPATAEVVSTRDAIALGQLAAMRKMGVHPAAAANEVLGCADYR